MQEIKISELPEATVDNVTNATLFVVARNDSTYSVTWQILKGALNG